MITRDLSNEVLSLAKQFSAVAVFGPRQSGKTTLVQHLFPQHRYLSLEDLDIRQRAQIDPRSFLQEYPTEQGIILDEVQHVPELLSYIQTTIDREKKKGFFIITGSQNLLLNEKVTQSLAGRIAIVTLLPLSLHELQQKNLLPKTIEIAALRGSYPALFADTQITPEILYANYLRTYVERDVRSLKQVGDLNTFQRFLQLCAGRTGQILNLTSLGNDCGIDHKTARAWISVLEASYIVFLLYPYYKNYGKRIIKSPKLYFIDTGILCTLLRIKTSLELMEHYLRGSIIESYIIADVLKQYYNSNERPALYFWRDTQGREIDLVLEHGTFLSALEIKAGRTVNADYFNNIEYFRSIAPETTDYRVIYAGDEDHHWPQAPVMSWQHTGQLLTSLTSQQKNVQKHSPSNT